MKKMIFFLGGKDAEMLEIERMLAGAGIEFVNKNLGWGAHASSYAEEIPAAAAAGKTLVLVELDNSPVAKTEWAPAKEPVVLPEGTITVDHHGDRSEEPASILQVLKLLGLKPSRLQQLIAANDSGFIPAMKNLGASAEEVSTVRSMDRAAQGITSEQEAIAEEAIAHAEIANNLTVVRMAHSKCATITDRLFGQYKNLLILSEDGEVNFYGDGAFCAELKEIFQGWNGGSGLGKEGGNAFWGGYPNHDEALSFIRKKLGA
jgi:hypothetical protein